MNNNLVTYPIPTHTPQWYEFRRNGIGGSEAAILLGLSEYGNAGKMYYEKLGLISPWMEDNEKMAWGRFLEEIIAEKWQYYDGTKTGYLDNIAADNVIRRCRKLNGYVVNPEYPWLFGSLDRVINKKGGFRLTDGEALKEEQGLEIKTMENFVADKWEGGLPVYHIVQVHQYMLITGMDYFEIVVLKNGRYMEVYPIERNENLINEIIIKTKAFWHNNILKAQPYARKLQIAQITKNKLQIEENTKWVHHFEPNPTAGESYRDFLSERFTKVHETVVAPKWLWPIARRHKELNAVIKYFESEKSLCANIMGKFLSDTNTSKAEFEENKGHIWYAQRGAGTRFVDNRVKIKVNELRVIEEMKKVTFNF